MYDPSNSEQPFGFIEVKCPYTHTEHSPLEACSFPGICCDAQLHQRRNPLYFVQVQGQMAVGDRPWCDFIIYTTTKGVNVERIQFDYWQNILPQREAFFNNCLGPEIVSPMHALGLPIHDLSK